jgi:hypothetical protein
MGFWRVLTILARSAWFWLQRWAEITKPLSYPFLYLNNPILTETIAIPDLIYIDKRNGIISCILHKTALLPNSVYSHLYEDYRYEVSIH